MNNLEALLSQLETKISFFETSKMEVSKANVGWHIQHTLLTINGITNFLARSNPKDYKWKFNFIRIVVLTLRKIPRGRAKAPEVVQPKGNTDKSDLHTHLSKTRDKIRELSLLSNDKYFEHPYFGKLKLRQTINFLEIHTNHHLKIITDIIEE